jgi:ribose transport system substrate-binding protein
MQRRLSCLLVLAAVALAGCSSKSNSDAKYRIAVIPKGLTHEFWQSIHRGAEQAAADLGAGGVGVDILWDGPSKESDAIEQINLIDKKIGMGIQGLVLAPQHSQQMVPPVKRAVDRGIPVVVIDSNLDGPDLMVKYVATDNFNGGKLAAKYLLRRLEAKGVKEPRLVLFRYQPGSESTEQREQGFLDQIAREQEAGKKITIVSKNQYAGATVETAEKSAKPLLVSLQDKNVDGIFAVNESATQGMLNALVGAPDIKNRALLMGFDSSKPLLKALRDGEVVGLVVQNPYRMGYLAVWTLVQHLEGYDVSPGGEKIQSTGEQVLTSDEKLADGKEVLYVDSDAARRLYDADRQKEQKIKLTQYKKR